MKKLFTFILIISAANTIAQNVGIGVLNPLAKLHVISADSGVAIFQNAQTLGADVDAGTYYKTGAYYTGAIKTIGTTYNASRMGFYTFAGGTPSSLLERMSILDNGLIGIGTTTPTSRLTIQTATNLAGLEHTDGNISFRTYINNGGANIGTNSGSLNLVAQNSTWLTVLPIGNVGIGTLTPTATLHVKRGSGDNGTAEFDGTTNASHFNYSTAEDTYIRGGKTTSQVIINDVSSGNVRLAEGGGNVGIGISNPSAKLEVNGLIKIDGGSPGTGKVLTSTDNTGIASWQNLPSAKTGVKIFTNSSTAVGNGSTETILFTGAATFNGKFDDGNNFNNTSHAYVAPADGVYIFNVTVSVAGGTGFATSNGYLQINGHGNSITTSNLPSSKISLKTGDILPANITLSFITKMDAGDSIYIEAYQTVSSSLTFASGFSVFTAARLY